MNRKLITPIPALSDCPVWWPQLIPLFQKVFPRTIEDCLLNDIRARVRFLGVPFDIIPEIVPGWPPKFAVWGPPHVNKFPDTL